MSINWHIMRRYAFMHKRTRSPVGAADEGPPRGAPVVVSVSGQIWPERRTAGRIDGMERAARCLAYVPAASSSLDFVRAVAPRRIKSGPDRMGRGSKVTRRFRFVVQPPARSELPTKEGGEGSFVCSVCCRAPPHLSFRRRSCRHIMRCKTRLWLHMLLLHSAQCTCGYTCCSSRRACSSRRTSRSSTRILHAWNYRSFNLFGDWEALLLATLL